MLHKVKVFIGIITIFLVLFKLISPDFEPFTGFIFAWMGLFFLLLGGEEFQKKNKFLGIVFGSGGIFLVLLVLMQ